MGGKLFDQPRMPRAEYLLREAEVRRLLDAVIPGAWRIPRYYGDKPDFGDLDVLVAERPDWEAFREQLAKDLGVEKVKVTGNVYSTLYRGLQTDFFTVPARYLDSAYSFMCFNDVGNFIGRICRRFELKYGEHGLAYVYRREGGSYAADLEVTTRFEEICAFLGLDHARWLAGFPTLPAVFEWVIESPWFSVAPYLDEVKGDLAKRAEVRPNVARFITWLRDNGVTKRVEYLDRKAYLPMVVAAFPRADLPAQIAREQALEARAKDLSRAFNGKKVMALAPHLRGEPLGEFIRAFKASIPDFETWLLSTPQEEVDAKIAEAAKTWPT